MTCGRLLIGALLASIALATGAAPARADDEIGLSLDGASWDDRLSSPLFEDARAWVPGDTEIRSFFVSNDGRTDARLLITVLTSDDDRLVADDAVELSARAAGQAWTSLHNGQDADPLVRDALAEDGIVRVDVRAVFRWLAPNESMVDALPLRIVVALRQDGPAGGAGDGPGGLLPDTGNAVLGWLVTAAGACVCLGLMLVVLARRRRSADA